MEDQQKMNDYFEKKLKHTEQQFKHKTNEIESVGIQMKNMENRLASKVEVSQVSTRLNQFCEFENMKAIETVFLPKMVKFCGNIDHFENDNAQVKECVRKFDEALSLKASKGEMSTQLSRLEKSFISVHLWEVIDKKLESIRSELQNEKDQYKTEM